MSGTLVPSGLKWNDPGDSTWDTDENDNITLLNDTLLSPQGLLNTDQTYFGATQIQQILRFNGSDYDIVPAPWESDPLTTTSSTTSSTTSTSTTSTTTTS